MPEKNKKPESFELALEGKKIPVLTLDHKWHQLFGKTGKDSEEIKKTEQELNSLLKRQGKLNTESKEIKLLKKKLMDEIVQLADENQESGGNEKQLEQHRNLLEECNNKLDAYQDELLELPREINQKNRELMLLTMDLCYSMIQENSKEIEEITEWIAQIRIELKKKVIRKQEKITWNQQLYSYMHDLFGADVIDLFDMKYVKDNMTTPDANGIPEEK